MAIAQVAIQDTMLIAENVKSAKSMIRIVKILRAVIARNVFRDISQEKEFAHRWIPSAKHRILIMDNALAAIQDMKKPSKGLVQSQPKTLIVKNLTNKNRTTVLNAMGGSLHFMANANKSTLSVKR